MLICTKISKKISVLKVEKKRDEPINVCVAKLTEVCLVAYQLFL